MKRLSIVVAIFCTIMLTTSSIVLAGPAGPPGGLDVKVLNTPLPVTGQVEVTNTETNPVPVTGNMTGTISGQVEVTNTEANPVAVQSVNNILMPVIISITGEFGVNERTLRTLLYTVPDDKYFVIEYVAARSSGMGRAEVRTLEIFTTLGEVTAAVPIDHFQEGGGGTVPEYIVSKQVRIYAGPGKHVEGFAKIMPDDPEDDTSQGTVDFVLQGHLLDID